MTPEPSLFLKKIRRLSQALMISGALNIGVLGFLAYWIMRERPPTPYCELKPAEDKQQQIPLADDRDGAQVIAQLYKLSYLQLVNRLERSQLIENGYAERDLALACLIAFHDFDLQRALPPDAQPQQKRLLAWKPAPTAEPITLSVYPSLTSKQYKAIVNFAKTEQWPMTAQGLFRLLKKQKKEGAVDSALIETFMLTPEFWTAELLFSRLEQSIRKPLILEILLERDWDVLRQFVEQQRQLHDLSDARRQKFLLDSIKAGSQSAAILLLKAEWEFAVKKLDDSQVIQVLQLLSKKTEESERFAKEMLSGPRSTNVWRHASSRLYEYAGEPAPKEWSYQTAVARFMPDKPSLLKKESAPSLPAVTASKPLAAVSSISMASSKMAKPPSKASTEKGLPLSTPLPKEPSKKEPSKAVATAAPHQVSPKVELKKAASPAPVKQASSERTYTVQEGDTLWKISRQSGVAIQVLKDRNQLQSDTLKPGMVLKLP